MMSHNSDHFPDSNDESIYIPSVGCAHAQCPCSLSRRCEIWTEFEIAMVALQDAEDLTRGNWIEITHLRDYTEYLESLLKSHGIDHLNEYGI
ncbi:MAG: mobility-associated LCxxNW protein [Clostridium sp.]|nr:mobility-associated LCxxNW protein [Clostridium sp.]